MILMYLHAGHSYRLADTVTVDAVNNTLLANQGKFFSVPLHPDGAMGAGSPEIGEDIVALFITPNSVSHFVVI